VNDSSIGGTTGSGKPAETDWYGIDVVGSGAIEVERARIRYATQGVAAQNPAALSVVDNKFRSIAGSGVSVSDNTIAFTVEDNTFQNVGAEASSQPAMDFTGGPIDPALIGGNRATGGYPFTALSSSIGTSGALPQSDPTWLIYSLDVPTGFRLKIDAGTILKGESNGAITVEGTLDASGSISDPVVFTSVDDPMVGGGSGTRSPAPGDWTGIELGPKLSGKPFPTADFSSVVLEYASTAVSIAKLDTSTTITDSVFSYNEAAISVETTADNDPVLNALPCVPIYLTVIDATTDWFGSTGYPGPDIDLLGLLGIVVPSEFSALYGAVTTYGSAEQKIGDNTVPWSIYTCPVLFDFPIPVTAVTFNIEEDPLPIYPLDNQAFKE
jgi:hypothetical protein